MLVILSPLFLVSSFIHMIFEVNAVTHSLNPKITELISINSN